MFGIKSGNESEKKLKGTSESCSKNFEFDEKYSCQFGGKYQNECDNYILESHNHETYLQLVKQSTLFLSDNKRCCENNIKKTVEVNFHC